MLVWLLQEQKQVKIERLAATLPLPIQQNSRRRHLQRFLSLNTWLCGVAMVSDYQRSSQSES